jgi:hypothetical protein
MGGFGCLLEQRFYLSACANINSFRFGVRYWHGVSPKHILASVQCPDKHFLRSKYSSTRGAWQLAVFWPIAGIPA